MAEDMKDYDVDGEDVMGDMEDDDMQDQGSLFWSLKVPVGNDAVEISEPSIPGYIIHITNASFGADVKKGSRTILTCTNYLDETFSPVCVLKEDKFESVKLDLLFGETAGFKVTGTKPSTVWLSGYLQPPMESDTNPSFDAAQLGDMDDFEDMTEEEMQREMKRRGINLEDLDEVDDDEEGDEEAPELVNSSEEPSEPANKKRKLNGGKASPKQTPAKQQQQQEKKQSPKQSPKVTPTPKSPQQQQSSESPKSQAKKKKKVKRKLSNGIECKDLKEGTGRKIKKGDTVYVYYIGQLVDQSIFDKTLSGRGFGFELGKGEVIKGWDIGLQGMKVGGKRKLWIPPKMGYGSDKMDKIPPNSQLIFTIEVKDVE